MNSLQELNTYGATSIEFDDDRDAKVIFNLLPPLDATDVTDQITTTSYGVDPTIEVVEIINYATADMRYRITINDITGSTISFGTLSDNLTLDDSVSGVYEISGFTDVSDWNTAKSFTWTLPSGYASDDLFWLDVEIVYYDEALGYDVTKAWKVYDPDNYYIAKLSSTFTSTAALTARYDVAVDFAMTATIETNLGIYLSGANMSSAFALTADGTVSIFEEAAASLNSSSSMTVSGDVILGWKPAFTILSPNNTGGTEFDRFPSAISLTSDYILVGDENDGNDTLSVGVGAVYQFDSADGTLLDTFTNPSLNGVVPQYYGKHLSQSTTYSVVANFRDVVSEVYGYNSSTGSLLYTIDLPVGSFPDIALDLSSNDSYICVLASISSQMKVYVYDTTDGSYVNDFVVSGTFDTAYNERIKLSGTSLLISHSDNDSVYLYNITTGNLSHTFTSPGTAVTYGSRIDTSGNYYAISDTGANKVYLYNKSDNSLYSTITTSISVAGFSDMAINNTYTIITELGYPTRVYTNSTGALYDQAYYIGTKVEAEEDYFVIGTTYLNETDYSDRIYVFQF